MVVGGLAHPIYASPQPTILSLWDLVSHVKYFQHYVGKKISYKMFQGSAHPNNPIRTLTTE